MSYVPLATIVGRGTAWGSSPIFAVSPVIAVPCPSRGCRRSAVWQCHRNQRGLPTCLTGSAPRQVPCGHLAAKMGGGRTAKSV